MPGNYYNEIDEKAAAWLEELIRAGEIPPGDVDRRDIRDVMPSDLSGYTQCHFFAGIGGWPLALRIAGWPEGRPVWTFSEPCQPFSAAGRRGGTTDERYLRPYTHHLVCVCHPPSIFGEQVASKDGLGWLDTLSSDMEDENYAIGTSDLCAAGVGAPHIRQRLFFGAYDPRLAAERLGDRISPRLEGYGGYVDGARGRTLAPGPTSEASSASALAHGNRDGCSPWREVRSICSEHDIEHGSATCDLADGNRISREQGGPQHGGRNQGSHAEQGTRLSSSSDPRHAGPTNGFWRDADWLLCRDDKWRPVEPGTFPLAHGVSGRVGLLRGYGNAISPWLAAEYIQAFEEARCEASRTIEHEPHHSIRARRLIDLLG